MDVHRALRSTLRLADCFQGELHGECAARELQVDNRTTLLDAMREHLHLTGTKKDVITASAVPARSLSMDAGSIRAFRSQSCMEGAEITTIEGLGTPDNMHPMQTAFVKHDGFQCGYCTPGQICSSVAVIEEIKADIPCHVNGDLTAPMKVADAEIRECMSGNICRCGAYPNIVAAIIFEQTQQYYFAARHRSAKLSVNQLEPPRAKRKWLL